jgi:sugar phosphate isomerase/epimerase
MYSIDRRSFITGASALIGAAIPAGAAIAQALGPTLKLTASQAARLAMTTACFRHNFKPPPSNMGNEPAASGLKLDMLTTPKFLKDTFGITNMEVWCPMVPDTSLDYARKMRAAAEAVGGRIINVQIDGNYDLSAADPKRREESVVFVKGWMDRAHATGSPSVRINIGGGPRGTPLALEPALASFRTLIDYGNSIGVTVLTENHGGVGGNIDNCVAFLRALNDKTPRAIIDWGSSSATTPEARLADLSKMFPYLAMVSAKGMHFDKDYRHLDYPISPLVRATEATGFRGIYSIELYAEPDHPEDPVAAARTMIAEIVPELQG